MNRPTNFTYAMTLRLANSMEADLEDLAHTLKLSKAGTIRRALRRAIADARRHEISIRNGESHGGAQW